MNRFEGTRVLVTGASRGLGLACARRFDEEGAVVVLTARHEATLASAAASLSARTRTVVADLAQNDAVPDLWRETEALLGTVDVLINNAGLGSRVPVADVTSEGMDEVLMVNLRNLMLLSLQALPGMRAQRSGKIVNITSVVATRGTPMRSVYSASKAGVEGFTRALAQEVGAEGVTVNAVAPGIMDTAPWAKNKALPGVYELTSAQIPQRRWSTAEEVAEVVAFLASPQAANVTGQVVAADGGMGMALDLYSGPI